MKKIIFPLLFLPILGHGQTISTVAGAGTPGYSGDGLQATAANLNGPGAVMADGSGNLYISDYNNHTIRKVSSTGVITTIAGTGASGLSANGTVATAALLNHPMGMTKDAAGNIYFCEYGNHLVRKIDAVTGTLSTIAGDGVQGYNGDGIPASNAQLSYPVSIARDAAGNFYITDADNQRLRKVNTAGVITTIAGTGTLGFSGDDGPATAAAVSNPFDLAVDETANIYFTDQTNHRIRKINSAGVISTIAGTGVTGYVGDGGLATAARFNSPTGMCLDVSGNLLIADRYNNCVRKITLATGMITTIAGTGTASYSGDGGPATTAQLNEVPDVAADGLGNIYIADFDNHRVRKVTPPITSITGPGYGNKLEVYPNPAQKEIIVSSAGGQIHEVSIVNLLGQNVSKLTGMNRKVVTVDISKLPAGVYMLQVNNAEAIQFVKE